MGCIKLLTGSLLMLSTRSPENRQRGGKNQSTYNYSNGPVPGNQSKYSHTRPYNCDRRRYHFYTEVILLPCAFFLCDLSKKEAISAAETLLAKKRNRPDAVFCVNDPVAIQLIMVAKQNRISVPEELGVVGFSDDPMAEIIEPALTTVQQPVSIIGREAMELLLDTIRLGEKFAPVTHSLKPRLIVRASSVRGQ